MSEPIQKAFGGDGFIEAEIRRLAEVWGIRTIIETGTYEGQTTLALADMGAEVTTIEIAPGHWRIAEELGRLGNVHRILGDSGKALQWLCPMVDGRTLFYLDAHGGAHSPLLDELEVISRVREKPVIAIHDFFNPAHPEYGFDTWDIGPYKLQLIEPCLEKIYGAGGWVHHFNDQAEGLKHGIIYIEPK